MSAGSSPSRLARWREQQRARRHERTPAQRFAHAVDSANEPGGPSDPKLAGELAVVTMLRRYAPDPTVFGPDAEARDRMRARVRYGVATMPASKTTWPRLARKPSPTPVTEAAPARTPKPAPTIRATSPRGRFLIAVGAAFCLVLALCGMTMLLSQSALPGDPLYGVRRTVQSAALELTMGTEAKGLKHLQYAGDSLAGLASLAQRYPDPAGAPVGDYLTGFNDFDADAAAGSADITGYATSNSPAALTTLYGWAATQQPRITALTSALPAQARAGATASLALLARIQQRAAQLLARTDCYTVTSGATDDLGALPATGPCDVVPGTPGLILPSPGTTSRPAQTPNYQIASGTDAANQAGPPATLAPTNAATFTPPPTANIPVTTPPPVTIPPSTGTTITIPLPLPLGSLPPVLPGLPGIKLGG